MQILEHHDQRAGPGQPPQQTQDGLAPHRRRRITMAPAAEDRHYRPERREPRRKVPVIRDTPITQRLEQRLGQRPIRDAGAAGDRPARCHRHVPRPGVTGHLADEPGLADARLASHEHQAARAISGSAQRRPQRAKLRLPPHNHRAQHIGHTASVSRPASRRQADPQQ